MESQMLPIFVIVIFGGIGKVAATNESVVDLYLLGLWPMQGGWPGGVGILPAALMALDHVNADPTILPGYRLNMIWNDTQVGNYYSKYLINTIHTIF